METKIHVMISGGPVFNEVGEVIGSIGIHHDLTDKMLVQQSLKEKNQELSRNQEFLSAINVFANLVSEKESLSELAEVITRNIMDHFHFEECMIYILDHDRDMLVQYPTYESKNNGNIANSGEIPLGQGTVGLSAKSGKSELKTITRSDGKNIHDDDVRYCELSVPILYHDQILGVIYSVHSEFNFTKESLYTLKTIAHLIASKIRAAVAREKKALVERELIESESKFRSIINSSLDAVIMINGLGKIIEWNAQAVQMFGFEKDEVKDKYFTDFIIPEKHKEAHIQGIKHFHATGEGLNQRIKITAIRKNKEEFPVELSIVPIKLQDEFYFSTFLRDITTEKQQEEETERALRKEKELNEMKSKFVSMTSHELRTPLTSIKTNVDLLFHKVENNLLNDQTGIEKNLHRIQSEVDRLTMLMNDILTIGQIESNRINFIPKSADLVELLRNVITQSFENQPDGRKVEVEVFGEERMVLIDRHIFTQIFTNLLSNAFKYSQGKPNPIVRLKFEEKSIYIEVQDEGLGIPLEDQEKLTESFFRASNVGNIQGTGMGMAIVKQFIKLHNGSMIVESVPNEGTKFTIKFPI